MWWQALDKCKVQEENIAELQGPLDRLRKSAQSEFDKVRWPGKVHSNKVKGLEQVCSV